MSHKFQSAVQQKGDVGYVKLSGVIDEDNELGGLSDQVLCSIIVLDLSEVERINSCGVRDWVNWLSALEARGSQIVFVKCAPAIVAQMNLVSDFTGNGSVKSFYVPYFCPECDEEKVLLCETAEMGPPPHGPPVCRCDGCDLVMDFDDMADSYFAFLQGQKMVPEGDQVQSLLDEVASEGGDVASIRSRVGTGSQVGHVSNSSLSSVPSLPSMTGPGSRVGSSVGSRPGALPDQNNVGRTESSECSSGLEPAKETEGDGLNQEMLITYALAGALVVATGVLGYLLLVR